MEFDLPKLYHGIVRREIFENIKKETGAYLKGLSPDIYAAISLAFTIKSFVVIDYPLTIPGVCSISSSIQEGEQKSNSKDIENIPHLKGRKIPYVWEVSVPKIYCVQTIWADSAFAAIREFKQEVLLDDFDKYMLCANILDADTTLQSRVYDFLHISEPGLSKQQLKKKVKQAMFKGPYRKKIIRIIGRVKRVLGLERYV
ncbi:hypothetical protein ABTN42_19835, partial [Acinetobacter baumannii]